MIEDLYTKLVRDYKKLEALRKEMYKEPDSFKKALLKAFVDILQRNAFNFPSVGMYDFRFEIGTTVYYLDNLKLKKFKIKEDGVNVYQKEFQMVVDKFYFDIYNNKRYESELISIDELLWIKEQVETKYPMETWEFFEIIPSTADVS